MKVLIIVPEYPPYNIGGGGIVYESLAYHLRKLGINVVVIWGYYKSDSLFDRVEKYECNGIIYYKIPEIPYPKSRPYLRTAMPPNLFGLKTIPKIIKHEKPDIAHLHGYGLILINIAAFWCSHFQIPYVFTVHGYPKTPEKSLLFKAFWRTYEKLAIQPTLHNAKMITCISKWLAEDERLKPFKEKVSVIYNGIDIKKFYNIFSKSDINIRSTLGLPRDAIILCSVGRIAEMKGFQLVIQAMPKLLEIYSSNVYYVIIGEDDGYKVELQKLATKLGVKENIIFTGFLDEFTKLKFIQECDVFVVPSLWEPFGLTALEGLAMKKIVVTTGAGGLREFLSGSKNIIFFDKNNIESLINAVTMILDGKVRYKEDHYLEKFSWDNIVKKYIKVYELALEM